jgi:DNA-binding Lrp family transcriptional regulator
MDRKLIILREVLDNSRISQRQLAKKVDLSLGTINALVQQLEADDIIVSKQINGKSTEYKLTDKGHLLKSDLTSSEAKHCYQFIAEVKGIIKHNLESLIDEGHRMFRFLGPEDEIYKLLKLTFKDLKRFHDISYELISELPINDKGNQLIAWENKYIDHENICHILLLAEEVIWSCQTKALMVLLFIPQNLIFASTMARELLSATQE